MGGIIETMAFTPVERTPFTLFHGPFRNKGEMAWLLSFRMEKLQYAGDFPRADYVFASRVFRRSFSVGAMRHR